MSVNEGSAAVCARPPNVSIWLGVETKVPRAGWLAGWQERARVKCRVFNSAPHYFTERALTSLQNFASLHLRNNILGSAMLQASNHDFGDNAQLSVLNRNMYFPSCCYCPLQAIGINVIVPCNEIQYQLSHRYLHTKFCSEGLRDSIRIRLDSL